MSKQARTASREVRATGALAKNAHRTRNRVIWLLVLALGIVVEYGPALLG